MKKYFGLMLVAIGLATLFFVHIQPTQATAVPVTVSTPTKYIITLEGWLEPFGLDTELKSGGWIAKTDKVIDFPYMNFSGTELQASRDALPRLQAVVNQYCFKGIPCEIHGYSRGADVMVWVENQAGWPKPGLDVYLHEPGAGDTGAIRSPYITTNPSWAPIYNQFKWLFGTPNLNAPYPTAGTQVYYNNADPFANLMPVCNNNAYALSIDIDLPFGHAYVAPKTAKFRVWVGPKGDVNHELGAYYPSGADVKSCPPLTAASPYR